MTKKIEEYQKILKLNDRYNNESLNFLRDLSIEEIIKILWKNDK